MPKSSRLQPLARAVLRTQTDDRLVTLARDGKEAAFEEIVRRYHPALVAFAAAYGPPDAEDVVQESLIRSWDALRDSTGEMHLKAWLYTIVRNWALNARRDTRAHEPLSEEIDGVRQPPEIVLTNEELDRAVAAVATLPEPQREALVRSALEGHTHEQIAASIGSTPGAVRQLIYRARTTVRHGVGLVIPLPIVAALTELGAGGAGVAASAAGGGVAAAGAAGGGSVATKVAIAAAVGAIAAGSGVAIKRSHDADNVSDQRQPAQAQQGSSPTADQATPAAAPIAGSGSGSSAGGPGSSGGGNEHDQGTDDRGSNDDDHGEGSSESSGPGSGPVAGSGPGSGGSGSGSSGHGSSGSGSSGSGHSQGGSSGTGGGGEGVEHAPEPVESENSGAGSGSSGSGSSGSEDSENSGSGGGGSGPEPPDDD